MTQSMGARSHLHSEGPVHLQVDQAWGHDRGGMDLPGQVAVPHVALEDRPDRAAFDHDRTGAQAPIHDDPTPSGEWLERIHQRLVAVPADVTSLAAGWPLNSAR